MFTDETNKQASHTEINKQTKRAMLTVSEQLRRMTVCGEQTVYPET